VKILEKYRKWNLFFSFGKRMRKIIMVKERKILKKPLLKGIKLQVSNVFLVKLGSSFP